MVTSSEQNIKVSINKNTVIQSLMFFGQFFICFSTVFYYIEKSIKSYVPFLFKKTLFHKGKYYIKKHILKKEKLKNLKL